VTKNLLILSITINKYQQRQTLEIGHKYIENGKI